MHPRSHYQDIRLRPIQLIKHVHGIEPDQSTHAAADLTVMCLDAPTVLPAGSMLQMPPRPGSDFYWIHERVCPR